MSKLYDEVMNVIDFRLDESEESLEEKICNKENKIMNILFWANIIVISFAIFCIIDEFPLGTLTFPFSITLGVMIIRHYQVKHQKRKNVLMNDKCNFNSLMTVYLVRARYHVISKKTSLVLLWNISSGLFYLGKTDEGKKVIDLIKRFCDTPEGNAQRLYYYAMEARARMDKEGVKQCIEELEMLMPQVKNPYIIKAYDTILKYPLSIEAEEKGDYAKALELIVENNKDSVLEKVNINYRLYKVAMAADLKEKASKHRAFVLENGGDTFYKRELEGELYRRNS